MTFTDYYAQQSCTAGRACFITGQIRSAPASPRSVCPAKVGLQAEDPTIAELLKPLGYATGQFGRNHLGDRDEYLPTVHGFANFFKSLSPECREGTGTARLPQRSAFEAVRSRRAPLQGGRQGWPDDHRPTRSQEAHGDDRRGLPIARWRGWKRRRSGSAVLPLVQFDRDAFQDPRRSEISARADRTPTAAVRGGS